MQSIGISPKSIVILRALQLGDLLCAVPAWRALRMAFRTAKISLVGLPWAREFVSRYHRYLDEWIEFPGFPGLPEMSPRYRAIPPFLERMQSRKFDLALQMQGSGQITNPLICLFGARRNGGFFQIGGYCPDKNRFVPYPESVPEVDRHLLLLQHLGVPLDGDYLEFPIGEEDRIEFRTLEESAGLQTKRYVCVHPGARATDRRWSAERFAAVADGLSGQGFQVVLTGSEEERNIANEVSARMCAPALNLVGMTTLGCLAVMLSKARALVCNDTGVAHLADALQTPSVVLFSSSSPGRWASKRRKRYEAIARAGDAQPEAVLAATNAVLEEEIAYAV